MRRLIRTTALVCACAVVLAVLPSSFAVAAGPERRVVLTWNDAQDLDLQATGPREHDDFVFALGPGETAAAGASLTTSRAPGPGRETITIQGRQDGIYQFYVFDYSARRGGPRGALSDSSARVQVFVDGDLERSFDVPVDRIGNVWTVCSLYGSELTEVGNMSFEEDQRAVGREVRTALIPGDILLGTIDNALVPGAWSHVAIYVGDGRIVEAANEGQPVEIKDDAQWRYPEKTWVDYLRVTTADAATRQRAADFAIKQVGKPYDIKFYAKQANGKSWYCSELVWAAYVNASFGTIDLQGGPKGLGVYPWQIARNTNVSVVGGHYEKRTHRSIRMVYLFGRLIWDHVTSWLKGVWDWLTK